MAGELCFRLFDLNRYHELLPCLNELASTRRLSDAGVATVKLALALPSRSRERHANEVAVLERIVRNRELEPRVFLSPTSLNDAITGLVELLCLADGGKWGLGERRVGPSWVVLEASLPALYEHLPWFEDIAHGLSPGSTELAYPRGVESFRPMCAPFDDLLAGLRTVSGKPSVDRYAREEMEGFTALVSRAQSERWSLASSTLL